MRQIFSVLKVRNQKKTHWSANSWGGARYTLFLGLYLWKLKKMFSFYWNGDHKRGVWRVCKRPLVDICSPSLKKWVPNFSENLRISDFKIVFIREYGTRQMTQHVHQTPQSTLYPPRKRTQISKIFQNFLIQTGQYTFLSHAFFNTTF